MWILAAIGFIVGAIAGLLFDFSPGDGAIVGALAGFVMGLVLHLANQQKTGERQMWLTEASRMSTLPERVARLEAEVLALRLALAGVLDPSVSVSELAPQAQPNAETQAEPSAQPAVSPPSLVVPVEETLTADLSQAPADDPEPLSVAANEPPPPERPREPDFGETFLKAVRDWLFGGNTIVRVGMIVLFFGVAFLLKYAADNSLLPIEFRLAGVVLAAMALIVAGWRIGGSRGAYGLVLQGGGVGVLYLTVFAATKLYDLLPASAAFPLMVVICALSAFLAVRQNASPLAFMGSAGGFLAPVLLASGGGSHVMLFSYYALLDAGIFTIAWFKAWRPLNLLGFLFTFSIGVTWGVTSYRPELFFSTEPFLVLFFLMYAGIALLYAVRREVELKHYVDGTLVFGTPIVTIGLQAALVSKMPFGLAFSAVALAAFYLGVASWLARHRERLRLMFESSLALGVIFATLAVPFAFSEPTTSTAWAIEGAAIVWMSVRQRRLAPFAFGLLMQVAAAGAFFTGLALHPGQAALPVLNGVYIATLLLALAGLFTGWWLHGRDEARAWHAWMPKVGLAASAWGLLWWIAGGVNEIQVYASQHDVGEPARFITDALVLFAVATAWLAHFGGRKLAWPLVDDLALALAPVLSVLALVIFGLDAAPSTGFGIVAWPLAAVAGYLLLWRQERDISDRWLAPLHTLMFLNLCGLFALEGYWRLRAYVPEGAWSWSAWAYGLGLILLLVSGVGARLRWPIARFPMAYQVWGALPLVVLLWAWSIASVFSDGDASPLFWLPILNPLDVAQLLIIVAAIIWVRRLRELSVPWHPRAVDYVALATLFLWFNALLLRTLHNRFSVDYDVSAVLSSFGLQQVFLAGWSVFAFAGLWFARRDSLARLCAIASVPLIVVMWLWTFYANLTQDGGVWTRVPLLNPLDLVQVIVYAVAVLWFVRVSRLGVPLAGFRMPLQIAVGVTGFLWINTMLLRTLHHWIGIAYTFDDMAASTVVQASVSVFWTVCALALMVWATRQAKRPYWFVGGALLAATIVKLFLFDLSHVEGIERIVSFIGIGAMLLLIGYFSPLPPKARDITETS
jgi:uncharacterized membrane protein